MKEKTTILMEEYMKEYGKIKQRNKELYTQIHEIQVKEELTHEDHELIMKCFNEIQANINSLDKFIR